MSAPSQFHELPEPASRVAGRNTADSFFSSLAKLWRPRDAFGEITICSVSRFAHRLIDRVTGEAYSADELIARITALAALDIPTILTPASNLALPVPTGTPPVGTRAKYHITPTAECALTIDPAIAVPTILNLSAPWTKTLNAEELYILQLEYSGVFWMLQAFEGGYIATI